MNWSEHFKKYIETFAEPLNYDSYFTKDKLDNIKNCINKNKNKNCFTLNDVKISTNFIQKNNLNIKYNNLEDKQTKMVVLGNSSDIFFKVKETLGEIIGKELYIPKNKIFANKNIKINNIDFSKLSYFINYFNKEQQREYIKFTPDCNNINEIKTMLLSTEIKLLGEFVLYNLNTENPGMSFRLKSIIIDYDYKLSKYPYIKKAFDIRYYKMKKERNEIEKKIKEDKVILDSKFNTFKFNKEKLNNSNNKIMELLHAL